LRTIRAGGAVALFELEGPFVNLD
jgi:hypothetical protein